LFAPDEVIDINNKTGHAIHECRVPEPVVIPHVRTPFCKRPAKYNRDITNWTVMIDGFLQCKATTNHRRLPTKEKYTFIG